MVATSSGRGLVCISTVEKLTVSGHSHLGCGAGGHPACRQVRESDRQDAYLPHSQDGCAPSSGALFNKAKRLPVALCKQNAAGSRVYICQSAALPESCWRCPLLRKR